MRLIFAACFALVVGSSTASAQTPDPYRFCADYTGDVGGSSNCYFMTLEQCQAQISGIGGFCRPNPFYTGPAMPERTGGRRR